VQSEREALLHHPALLGQLLARAVLPGPGSWQEIEPTGTLNGLPYGNVILCHVRDVTWFPRLGLILGANGIPLSSSFSGKARDKADAGVLPGRRFWSSLSRLARPTQRLARAAVWMNLGAQSNYGHFIFDGLSALGWMDDQNLSSQFAPVAPPLAPWQRDLLHRTRPGRPMQIVDAQAVRIDEVLFTSCLNHYLHRNAGLFTALAHKLHPLRCVDKPLGHGAVYLSRRGLTGRIMVNEAELEQRLQSRGVTILRPERMSVDQQIVAVKAVRTVIGASGAALANLCFLPQGGRLIEVRPAPVREPWLDLACANLGLEHRVVAASEPLSPRQVPAWHKVRQLPRKVLGRYHYCFEADIDLVLKAFA
jgi:capsular polysaccharide biosynthesis protein